MHFIKMIVIDSKSQMVLLVDKIIVIAVLALAVVYGYFYKDSTDVLIILFVMFFFYQVAMFQYQYHQLIKPLKELEKTASIFENHELTSGSNYLGNLTEKNNKNKTERLIECVKILINNDYTSQMLKSQAEMHALQSQINPHFLYNTLETIRSHALAQQSIEIAEMTEALATLFRYSISKPGEMATFLEEIENVTNYLLIQQYRFPSKIRFNRIIEDESINGYRLPILTIQPIVENAMHHGLETKQGIGHITIRAFCTKSRLVISVNDDGLGMTEEKLKEIQKKLESAQEISVSSNKGGSGKKAGIALINVNQRIKFYFGPEYGLKVRSTLGVGTTVEIILPIADGEKVKLDATRGFTD